MPAVVRVKRRIDEEPLGAFLLNGKKRRIEDGGDGTYAATNNKGQNANEISTVLKFAGTINKENDTTQILRLTKDAAKELVQQKSKRKSNYTERLRNEIRQSEREQRFRVVNCMRTNATANEEITIVDIEKEKSPSKTSNTTATASEAERPSDSDTGYVYDLYFPENEQLVDDVDLTDNYLSIRAVNELVYEDCYRSEDDSDHDSQDSNGENYYANDYPDENGSDASEEDEMREMVDCIERFVFDDDDEEENEDEAEKEYYVECSSEDERNPYVDSFMDSISTTDEEFVDDVDDYGADISSNHLKKYERDLLASDGSHKSDEDEEEEEEGDADDEKEIDSEHDDNFHSASEN